MVWPPPPEPAKIEYLYSFSKPEDLKINKKSSEKIIEFLFGRGQKGVDALARPQGIYSRGGITLVTDTMLGCVHVFNQDKREYFKISQYGGKSLLFPIAVAADDEGKIYVSDSKLAQVLIFNSGGEFVKELGAGKLLRPCGIAIDPVTGKIFIVDALKGQINVFAPEGDLLFSFGAGSLNHPTYISLDKDRDLYVVDSLNFKVKVFSREGKLKSSFGRAGRVPGAFSQPKAIAVDSDQNIYVTDSSFDNVQIFDRKGNLLLFFGEAGNRPGEFWLPAGIAIDENDRIFVADSYNGRVQAFRYLK